MAYTDYDSMINRLQVPINRISFKGLIPNTNMRVNMHLFINRLKAYRIRIHIVYIHTGSKICSQRKNFDLKFYFFLKIFLFVFKILNAFQNFRLICFPFLQKTEPAGLLNRESSYSGLSYSDLI